MCLCRVAEAARLASPKQITIGGRSHAVGRPNSRPSSALGRHSPSDSLAAIGQRSSRQPSGSSTPGSPATAAPRRSIAAVGSDGRSHANAVVDALGQLSPAEVDRLQRVLQQGHAV